MLGLFPPSRKPTPAEYAVLVVFISAIFIVLGVVVLVAGFLKPPGEHALAVSLEYHGAWYLAIGVAIALGFWLFLRLFD